MDAQFQFSKTNLGGVLEFTFFCADDLRGGFSKIYEQGIFEQNGIDFHLSESFVSISSKNVIRGLHFQTNFPQAKIVSVLKGRAYDVAVDLRKNSGTYAHWQGFELSSESHKALYIPKGFAHGFLSLEDDTVMLYQCDGRYDKLSDTGIRFDDPRIGIKWPIGHIDHAVHSERDLLLQSFEEYEQNPMLL